MFSIKCLLNVARNAARVNASVLCKSALHGSAMSQAKVALILSGSGVYDGSEIHEVSSCLVQLSREGAEVSMYAPDVEQMHVVDHLKGQPQEGASRSAQHSNPAQVDHRRTPSDRALVFDTTSITNIGRNVLVESARIARGKIEALSQCKHSDHDALIIPGGFGAAKNLCTFAIDGIDCQVNTDLERVVAEFHTAKKPIGLCCIAPVLAAKLIPGCEVTVGHETEEDGRWPYASTVQAIRELGAKHIPKDVTETCIDTENKLVTTPAFMCETEIHHVSDGVSNMVKAVLELTE